MLNIFWLINMNPTAYSSLPVEKIHSIKLIHFKAMIDWYSKLNLHKIIINKAI